MPPITQRTVILSLFGLLTIGSCISLVNALLSPTSSPTLLLIITTAVGTNLLLLALYWHGWEQVRYLYVVVATIVIGAIPQVAQEQWFYILLSPALAAVLAGPAWIISTAILGYLVILLHAGGQGPITSFPVIIFLILIVGAISLGRWLTSLAQGNAEQHAQAAQAAQARAEAQAAQLVLASKQQAAQLTEQQRLLELVATLETPAIQLADQVFIAPLMGHLDGARMQRLMTQLLHTAYTQRARVMILDLAGVPVLELDMARALWEIVQALRLVGCTVLLSSLSSATAQVLSQDGWTATEVVTVRSPQEALERARALR